MEPGSDQVVGPAGRLVEVAVDVGGAAGSTVYTYAVPPLLGELSVGELALVDYGRRQALGIVLGPAAAAPDGVEVRPVRSRVRAGGPLLPALQVELARWAAGHYLAPIAAVVRAFLPPGMLERVELVARAVDGAPRDEDVAEGSRSAALVEQVAAAGTSGIPVRSLRFDGSRAALLQALHGAARHGAVSLEWTLRDPTGEPRRVAMASLTEAGLAAASGSRPPGRPLGPRQLAVLGELLGAGAPVAASGLAAGHGHSAVTGLVRRGLVRTVVEEVARRPLGDRPAGLAAAAPAGAPLTGAQAGALRAIEGAILGRRAARFLLDGAAGGGKTAVYARAIATAMSIGRGAVVLVPEIALAVPLIDRLRTELGVAVALLHGALTEGERADEWRRLRSGEVSVVVGTRSAVLAPVPDPGVVIVDEEHEAAYKSDRTPRYQARDLALELGRLAGAPVILGSATPDVVTVGRARAGEIERWPLPERPGGSPPQVEVVDLREELRAGNRGMLSGALVDALEALRTDQGDRAILVMNRRGTATVVICRDCGYVQVCPECERPLVYHARAAALRCHHCGATAPPARRCPACESPRIRYLGGGTERLEREVRDRFPAYRVARLDRDVAERRGATVEVLDAFRDGAVDVLVGTSIVAKGIDVPEVTLSAVVSADVALNLPDPRAGERTYQLLVQAVGRAGRGARPGAAIIQTYQPEHPAVRAAASGDADRFYTAELASREAFGFPPYGRLVKLTVALPERDRAEGEARRLASELRARAASPPAVSVLGPVPAYVPRRGGRWRFHVILRGLNPVALLGRDPGPPWSVDVDPETVL